MRSSKKASTMDGEPSVQLNSTSMSLLNVCGVQKNTRRDDHSSFRVARLTLPIRMAVSSCAIPIMS